MPIQENTEREQKSAVGYIRVEDFDQLGGSALRTVVAQKERIYAVARAQSLSIREIVTDIDRSPNALQRLGINRLFEQATTNGLDYCIVPDADHITRSHPAYTEIAARLSAFNVSILDASLIGPAVAVAPAPPQEI